MLASKLVYCGELLPYAGMAGKLWLSGGGHVLLQVVDEADRLLRQAYQDWLPFVVAAGGAQQAQHGCRSGVLKFVASATLTRDPAKIDRLGLHCPRYLALEAADTRYKMLEAVYTYCTYCEGQDLGMSCINLHSQAS